MFSRCHHDIFIFNVYCLAFTYHINSIHVSIQLNMNTKWKTFHFYFGSEDRKLIFYSEEYEWFPLRILFIQYLWSQETSNFILSPQNIPIIWIIMCFPIKSQLKAIVNNIRVMSNKTSFDRWFGQQNNQIISKNRIFSLFLSSEDLYNL